MALEIEKKFVVRRSHASQGYMSSMGVPCEIRWRVGLPSVDATRANCLCLSYEVPVMMMI